MQTRTEVDSLGEKSVPKDAYYGIQTLRAVENFSISGIKAPRVFVHAFALVKEAAAIANMQVGWLEPKMGNAIVKTCDEILSEEFSEQFVVDVFQAGAGTSFNMNVNEVIAHRASEILGGQIGTNQPVHPNDHVNMSQSTNDTVPTSMHIAAATACRHKLLPTLDDLYRQFAAQAQAFKDIVKIGRTHLQDATPLTLGQEFGGYASQLEAARETINNSLGQVFELPIGATAVGTGLNTKVGFDQKMVEQIINLTNLPFRVARNKFAGLAAHDAVVALSGALRTLAAALMKIANDIRLLASGPRCGLGEITLPANEPGSSIMPGKVNPTQCEMVTMVACQVYGNDTAIALAGSQGNLQLNVYKPLMAYNLINSINLLGDAMKSFQEKCVVGIKPNQKKIAEHLHNSLMLVTVLNRRLGYDQAAQIALKAWREDKTLKQAALELKFLTAEQFDRWVRPEDMTGPDNNDE